MEDASFGNEDAFKLIQELFHLQFTVRRVQAVMKTEKKKKNQPDI